MKILKRNTKTTIDYLAARVIFDSIPGRIRVFVASSLFPNSTTQLLYEYIVTLVLEKQHN